jgi:hypothetical protein
MSVEVARNERGVSHRIVRRRQAAINVQQCSMKIPALGKDFKSAPMHPAPERRPAEHSRRQ